jgi:hypothetical protein
MTRPINLLIDATKFQFQLFGLLGNLCLIIKAFTDFLQAGSLRADQITFTIIFKDEKIQGNQAINNQLYYLETIHLVKNAKTEMEIAEKEKIERFIETLKAKKEFTKKDIEVEYNKVSPIRECSLKAIELVLKNYLTLTYDKRKKIFKVKMGQN